MELRSLGAGDVIAESHGTTRLLRLNRPNSGNAISGTLLDDLISHVETAVAEDSVRAIATIGVGSAYCVGADFDELDMMQGTDGHDHVDLVNSGALGGESSMRAMSHEQRQLDSVGLGRWVLRFYRHDKPTIAALNGATAGGGFALALLHDFRFMASTARITPGFGRLGLGPEMGVGWLLPRTVGQRAARDMLYRCPVLTAEEALEVGLVDEVVEPELLELRTLSYAKELAAQPALATRAAKRLLTAAAELDLDQYLEREWLSQVRLAATPEARAALTIAGEQLRVKRQGRA